VCQPLLTPEAARARATLDQAVAAAERKREGLACLLAEIAAFTRNHPEVKVAPPWETMSGCRWEVTVAGMTACYDDPQFMLTVLAERWGFTDDL
jgi:hypothetical protein